MKKYIIRILVVILGFMIHISCSRSKDDVKETVIEYTDSDGETYPVIAVPEQVIICFSGIDEGAQRQVIEDCGGTVVEHYPLLDSYLVKTNPGGEMDFVTKARGRSGVDDVYFNVKYDSKGVNMHLIDDFNENEPGGLVHGEYCYESALTAYPEKPDRIVKVSYDVDGSFSQANIEKYLNNIFESTEPDSLILINMSFGTPLCKMGPDENNDGKLTFVENDKGGYVHVTWAQTFNDKYGEDERKAWKRGYIDLIDKISNCLIKLSKKNRNFIVFKAAGNEYCHELDRYVFNDLHEKLSEKQLKMVRAHLIHVCAKDDSNAVEGELYADYSNSPVKYSPYLTMTDISHLKADGTSFASPFLLGKAIRLFDIKGYKPLGSGSDKSGYTVIDVMKHIKKATRRYAKSVKQPGLYTDDYDPKDYYYNRQYSFTGVLRRDSEDLCETGVPETYYYLEINPIDIIPDKNCEIEDPLTGVTRLQIVGFDVLSKVGQKITLKGKLMFHIASCHIHTDAYLENSDYLEETSSASPPGKVADLSSPEKKIYYYNDLHSVISGVLRSKNTGQKDNFTGEQYIEYYILLDTPISVKDRNEGNPRLAYIVPTYNKTRISLYGHFRPKDFIGLNVIVVGQFQVKPSANPDKDLIMCVNNMYLK